MTEMLRQLWGRQLVQGTKEMVWLVKGSGIFAVGGGCFFYHQNLLDPLHSYENKNLGQHLL